MKIRRTANPVTVARRRRRNPQREARRQAHITRMRHRIVDYVPRYRDLVNGAGEIVRSIYVGHTPVYRSYT